MLIDCCCCRRRGRFGYSSWNLPAERRIKSRMDRSFFGSRNALQQVVVPHSRAFVGPIHEQRFDAIVFKRRQSKRNYHTTVSTERAWIMNISSRVPLTKNDTRSTCTRTSMPPKHSPWFALIRYAIGRKSALYRHRVHFSLLFEQWK